MSVAERFWKKVDKSGECWLWTAAVDKWGYGTFWNGEGDRCARAHRLSWELHFGDRRGLCVCHHCDNPRCVRPDHLFLASNTGNRHDMIAKGRARYLVGSSHQNSKLTETIVRDARLAYASGGTTYAELAKQAGVTYMAIYKAIRRETWTHVE